MHIERLLILTDVPIITLNTIDNMKETESFKRNQSAVNFKISYLRLKQERRKNNNALLLNVLLYLLALIGSISALQVLQSELGWSFKIGTIALVAVFIVLGAYWIWQEQK